jgi:hypothetical protein
MILSVLAVAAQMPEMPEVVHPVMLLLQRGIPLTLLVDLADSAGPASGAIYRGEPPDFR